MGFRFRRSVRIAPGIRLNLSKSGVGVSAGPSGARVGVGPRGVHGSLGIPGTGLHYRKEARVGGRSANRTAAPGSVSVSVQVSIEDDGSVELRTMDGHPAPPGLVRHMRQHHADELSRILEGACERWNAGIDAILNVHLATPEPSEPLILEPAPFDLDPPSPPALMNPGLLDRIVPSRRNAIEAENRKREAAYDREGEIWQNKKRRHEAREIRRRKSTQLARDGDVSAMVAILESQLAALEWPRETLVDFDVRDPRHVLLDVDLPPAEEMPSQSAQVAARGLRILVRDKSATQMRREYMQHVHSVVFRIVGEVMHVLPTVEIVTASAYTQVPDTATGYVKDEYLLSACVSRERWQAINFDNLEALDLPLAFEAFDLKRNMTRTGIFRPIEPFE